MNAPVLVVQHVRAPNDRNGNPRRCFVLYRVGYINDRPEMGAYADVVTVEDQGYSGEPKEWRAYPHLPSVQASPTEYKAFLALP